MDPMSEPKITPLARRLAEENGIDWRQIVGSGPDGMVTERDILNYLAKVMSGEVTLEGPPPGEPPPPEGEADLEAARSALEREGVVLDDLIPGDLAEKDPGEAFELDLAIDEWDLETESEPREAATAEEAPAESVADALELEAGEALKTGEPDEEAPPVMDSLPPPEDETAPLVLGEEGGESVPAEAGAVPGTPEPEAAPLGVAGAGAPSPVPLRFWAQSVPLSRLIEAREVLQAELGRPVPLGALLFRAATAALEELALPLDAVKGVFDGTGFRGLSVLPAPGLVDFLEAWEGAESEAEGLLVYQADSPLPLPAAPALALALPETSEQQGLLLLTGEVSEDPGRFLARVAHRLEHPVLLVL